MKFVKMNRRWTTGRTAIAFAAATVLASSTCVPVALAEGGSVAEGQTGSGETSLVLKLSDTHERGGANAVGEYANPDKDGDGLGDNLAFTVPIRLDFAALASGELVGPSADAAYVKNESRYPVRVSALDVDEKNGWHIVSSARDSSQSNAIDLQIGPTEDKLDAFEYLNKTDVKKPGKWNMAAKDAAESQDKIVLVASGNVNNIVANVTEEMTFGQINWYVRPGAAA